MTKIYARGEVTFDGYVGPARNKMVIFGRTYCGCCNTYSPSECQRTNQGRRVACRYCGWCK